MRRAAQAFVVTVLAIVAGIWVRELGPPLDGGDKVWSSRDARLRGVSTVLAVGPRHTVVGTTEGAAPVVVDRRDGSLQSVRGTQVLAVSRAGTAVSTSAGRLYGDRTPTDGWQQQLGPLLGGGTPAFLGSTDDVLAVGGCEEGQGVVVGLDLDRGERRWRLTGPCAAAQPDGGGRYLVTTRPARAFPDGPALDVALHEVSDGRRVADLRRVRAVRLVGDDLLVLDADHQLYAQRGSERRWLLDPTTAALADAPATGLAEAFARTPAVVFADGVRALVDTNTGTLRREQRWVPGPLTEDSGNPAVAFGREHAFDQGRLVVRSVFTGRQLWAVELPEGTATADLADPAVVVVSVALEGGRHQAFAYDALTGARLARTRHTERAWHLLPTGAGTLLASDGPLHYLLALPSS